jgi:PAS domain S-box-containing protein
MGYFSSNRSRTPARTPANRGADLTEKGRAEQVGRAGSRAPEAQSQTEAVLATLLDSVGCGILLAGTGGDLWAVNDRLAEILGHAPERLREFIHLDEVVASVSPQFANSDRMAARWRQRFQNGEPAWDELEMITPERKVLERYARPVLDQYKQPRGWLEIYRDISGQRQIESRLFHSERLAALGQMLSGVAHELTNPLTSVLGYAQLVQRRAKECERETQHILEEAERARRIARNLLLFARDSTSERMSVSLNEIVERTVAIRAYELRLDNISVELDLDRRVPATVADGAQIQQALLNLMLNAEQAIRQIRENGHIWIRTRQLSASRVALEVADDGPGVAPEVVLHIFDPFFTTKPAGMGTGLGLSILYGIVQQHGGEVSVGTRPGGGAVFTMELPSSTPGAIAEKLYVIAGPGGPAQAGPDTARKARILAVEDEPTVLQLIADVLREEGYRVDTVVDSRQGLELARANHYDLLICDLRMPHLDGRGFYGELAREENPLRHRLIFVTGDTLAPKTVDFLRSCGLPYLAKPFLVDELKEVVARRLEKTGQLPSSAEGGEPEGYPFHRHHGERYEH